MRSDSYKGLEQYLEYAKFYVRVSRYDYNPLSSNTGLGSMYFQKSLGVRPSFGLFPWNTIL